MNRLLFAILTVLLCGEIAAQPQTVTLYGDDNHPPYSYRDTNGKPAGIYTEIIQAIIAEMPDRYRISIELVPWKRGLKYMEQGAGFALFPLQFKPLERLFIWPYSREILAEYPVLFCRKGVLGIDRYQWPKDFAGLRFGISAGGAMGGEAFWQAVESRQISVQEHGGIVENLQQLMLGRNDCHINDQLTANWTLKQLEQKGIYEPDSKHERVVEVMAISLVQHGFLGYSNIAPERYPYKDDFARQFDSILYRMKRTGVIQRILSDFLAREQFI